MIDSASDLPRRGRGRPRVTSRETIVEAACELYLERGFDETSITDIAQRAGMSRSSFFNYAGSKSDLLWAGFDERIAVLETDLAGGEGPRSALLAFGDRYRPDEIALVHTHADAMGMREELERSSAVRTARIAALIAVALRRAGEGALRADVRAGAYAAALMVALQHWAHTGAGTRSLSDVLAQALDALS